MIYDLDNVLRFVYAAQIAVYENAGAPEQQSAFVRNARQADSVLNDLSVLFSTGSDQMENLKELRLMVSQRLHRLTSLNSIGPSSLEASENPGNDQLIEKQILRMQKEERALLVSDNQDVLSYTNWIKLFNIISIIIAIVLTLFSLVVFNKENKAKEEEAKKALDFRKQLESRVEELANLNQELIDLRSLEKYAVTGRIARTIAHEVRNPLTNINLSIEQLKAEIPQNDVADMFFAMVQRNSERINQLVSDLLSATRVSDLNFSGVCVNDIVDASLVQAADRIELKHVQLEKHYASNLPMVKADEEKIKVVFLNIIVNAIEAMKSEGKLVITTRNEDSKCLIEIKDTGNGMTADQLNNLFEPYFTTKQKGNGLGLANSQNIVLAHNGSIRVESTLGEGSVFTVILPIDDGE